MFGAMRQAQDEHNLRVAWDRHVKVADRDPYGQTPEYAQTSAALDEAQARVPWAPRG